MSYYIIKKYDGIYIREGMNTNALGRVNIDNLLSSDMDHTCFIIGLINYMKRENLAAFSAEIQSAECAKLMYSVNPELTIEHVNGCVFFVKLNEVTANKEPEKGVDCNMSVFTPEEVKNIREMIKWFGTGPYPMDADDKFDGSRTVYDKDNSKYRTVKDGDVVLIEVPSDISPQSIASLYFSNYTFKTVKLVAKYDAPSDRYEVKYSNDTSVYVRPDDVLSVADIYLHEFIGTGACGGPTVYE